MNTFCSMKLMSVVILLCAVLVGDASGAVAYVKRTDRDIAIGNEFIELGFLPAQGRWAATWLANRLARRTLAIRSDDFSIGIEGRPPLRAADFPFEKAHEQEIAGGRRLTLRSESNPRGVRLDVIYELGDRDFFIRRRLELSVSKPLPLRQVDVWLAGIEGTCSHQGYGEPVFLEDTFWGLEFPGGHDSFAGGVVKLTQFPGRTVTDRFVSKTALVGVAEPDRVVRRFREYVATFQTTPPQTRLFVNYNTWWTLMPPTEKNCLELVDLFRRKLFDPHGESFDTFTIDDGWDDKNSLWDIRTDRYPNGFTPLVEPLKSMKANLGLWLSPSSGYGHAPWGGAHGYEHNSNKWYLCQSGPKYRRDIVKVVTGLARKYDMAFFKFDGFCASCEAGGHGHLPGNYAKEANIDAYIELLTAVRNRQDAKDAENGVARPRVFLDPTCGIWLSPWWLMYADSLWGSVSGDYPNIVVPAPVIRDSATTTRDAVFRQRCRQHPGYPPSAIEHLGVVVITGEKWEDNAMAVVGRGCRLLTLYINPKFFRNGDRDWAFLASVLKWVRHNAATLGRTELIGGDPLKREPYGYAHFRGDRGIISLRNPFIEPKTVKLKLDESIGWSRADAPDACVARIVYPRREALGPVLHYGDTLELKLQAYEAMILHVEPAKRGEPRLLAARCQGTGQVGKRISYTVYGRAGQKLATSLVGAPRPTRASLDGQPITPSDGKTGAALALVFEGREQACTVEGGPLAAQAFEASWQIVGKCVATVPAGTKAAIHVLCDPRGGFRGTLDCAAQVNGKPVKVRAVRRPERRKQTHKMHSWTWFEFPAPAGRSEVAIAIKPSEANRFFRGEVGWWLWAEISLEKRVLTLEFDKPLPPARSEPLPLPLDMEHERRIVTIQAPTIIRAGSRWPKLDRPAVHLDEVPPDEVSQDWGKLQRNQSVWEKPMIIAGRKFTRGIGTHANSRIVYELAGGDFKTFRCLVGRDEHAGDGRLVFQVWVGNRKVFDSGPMTKASPPKPVEVRVTGAAALELRTLDGGDGISGDHGNWADARLLR